MAGLFDLISNNPLESAVIGTGLLGTGFGAYSTYQQQKRLRDLYNLQKQAAMQLTPQGIVQGSEPLYQQRLATLRQSLPDILRQTAAPQMGLRGIDPTGGYGQMLTMQATAPYLMDARNQSVQDYISGVRGQMQGYQGAQGSVGEAFGGGGLNQSLQSLMILQALKNRQNPTQDAYSSFNTSYTPTSGVNLRGNYGGGNQLDFGMSPYQQSYFPDQSLLMESTGAY